MCWEALTAWHTAFAITQMILHLNTAAHRCRTYPLVNYIFLASPGNQLITNGGISISRLGCQSVTKNDIMERLHCATAAERPTHLAP